MDISLTCTATTKKKRENAPNVSTIHLFGRDRERRRVHVSIPDFHPYFYIEEEPNNELLELAENARKNTYKTLQGEKELTRLEFLDKTDVRKARDYVDKHYEADILFHRRFIIDKLLESGFSIPDDCDPTDGVSLSKDDIAPADIEIEPRVFYLDIELSSPPYPFPDTKNPDSEIVLITFHDSYTDDTIILSTKEVDVNRAEVIVCDDEIELVKRFIQAVDSRDPSFFLGWNVRGFDLDYMVHRMSELGISPSSLSPLNKVERREEGPKILGRQVLELRDAYIGLTAGDLHSYSLDHIVEVEDLPTKQVPIHDFQHTWTTDPTKLADHNYADVYNMVELDDKLGLTKFFVYLSNITGLNMSETLKNSVIVDTLILKYAKENNYVLPSRGQKEYKKYVGGKVLEPDRGIFENILVLDFASFYPSIIQALNISPEVRIPSYEAWKELDIKTPMVEIEDGYISFSKRKKGIIPKLTNKLMDKRNMIKERRDNAIDKDRFDMLNRRQEVIKYIINSFYGTLAWPSFRLFDWKIAQTITFVARDVLSHLIDELKEKEYVTRYGDTDSCMIQIEKDTDIEELTEIANKIINDYGVEKYGIERDTIVLEPEKVYDRILFLGVKKKYAGKIRESEKSRDQYEFTGLSAGPRTTSSNFTSKIQRQVLKMILDEEPKKRIIDLVRESIRKYRWGKVPLEDMGVPTKLKKDPSSKESELKELSEDNQSLLTTGQVPTDIEEPEGYDKNTMWYQAWRRTKRVTNIEYRKGQKPLRLYSSKGLIFFMDKRELSNIEPNYEEMINKTVRNKLEDILNIYDIEWDDVSPRQYRNIKAYT